MGTRVPKAATAGHCGENLQLTYSDSGRAEPPHENHRRNQELIAEGYEVLRGAGKIATLKQLAAWLGRDVDYADRIGDALNRREERYAHFDWLIPLLRHPAAGPALLQFFCRIAGYEMPMQRRPQTAEERLRRLVRRCEAAGSAGRVLLEEAADDCDLDVETFRR